MNNGFGGKAGSLFGCSSIAHLDGHYLFFS